MNSIELARELAASLHSGRPYAHLTMTDHVFTVAHAAHKIATALDVGFNEQELQDIIVVALLHDSVEDVLGDMRCSDVLYTKLFGSKVSGAIQKLTHRGGNYEAYLSHICDFNLRSSGEYAVIVKLADSVVNYEMSKITNDQRRMTKYFRNIDWLKKSVAVSYDKGVSDVDGIIANAVKNVCWALTPVEKV